MSSDKNSLRVHPKDSNSIAREKNEKLLEIVRRLEKENNKLKSQYKTMETAWGKTEEKYKEAVKDIPLKEIMDSVKNGNPLQVNSKNKDGCGKCGSKKLKKIVFDGFYVVKCDQCSYRNRVDDNPTK